MENLYNDLQPAIQKFSEIFCVSTEYIQEHFMEYVLEYGKYCFIKNIGVNILLTMLFAAACLFIASPILLAFDIDGKKLSCKKIFIAYCVIVFILFVIDCLPFFCKPNNV